MNSSLFKASFFGGLTLLGAAHVIGPQAISHLLPALLGLGVLTFAAERAGTRAMVAHLRRRHSPMLSKVLVVGDRDEALPYLRTLDQRSFAEVVGFLTPNGSGAVAPVDEALKSNGVIDEVVAASRALGENDRGDLARWCAARGITFHSVVDALPADLGSFTAIPLDDRHYLLSAQTAPQATFALFIKRAMDIVGAIVGLVLCAAAWAWYRGRIRRETGGTAIFRQTRVGRSGRQFTFHKFRTMYVDAEDRLFALLSLNEMKGPVFKMRDDPRVTPLGRTLRRRHIDELPQFYNVLIGDMSLVGSRPPVPDEVARYKPNHFRRLRMKPGITGLWQLYGNGEVNDFEEIVELDNRYIDHWSLWLDLKILLKTVFKVIFKGNGW